jgi:hypothetical protein
VNICKNCNDCRYSRIDPFEPIKLGETSTVGYCELGVPIECRQGKLPRELQENNELFKNYDPFETYKHRKEGDV